MVKQTAACGVGVFPEPQHISILADCGLTLAVESRRPSTYSDALPNVLFQALSGHYPDFLAKRYRPYDTRYKIASLHIFERW